MKYEIDWTDQAYPEIVKSEDGTLTFYEAKKEVINHANSIIDHWKYIRQDIRSKKAKNVGTNKRTT